MLRRMKVTMPLGDADSVADGNLDIHGGGWAIIGPRARRGQTCAEREPWLDRAPVPVEGIAAMRWGVG